MSNLQDQPASTQIVEARRREMAIEHLLFGTIRFLSQRHPELLDELESSLRTCGTWLMTAPGAMRQCAILPTASSRACALGERRPMKMPIIDPMPRTPT
jgi:hypothetical protein